MGYGILQLALHIQPQILNASSFSIAFSNLKHSQIVPFDVIQFSTCKYFD